MNFANNNNVSSVTEKFIPSLFRHEIEPEKLMYGIYHPATRMILNSINVTYNCNISFPIQLQLISNS